MESTETTRGKKKLIDDGYMFIFHAFSADSTKLFWRCVIRSCQCRLHMDVNDVIVSRLGHHTHGSDAAGVEVAKIKANMKLRAMDAMELPSQIHNQVVRFTGQSIQRQMPSISATKKLIQRARDHNEAPLPTPADLESLVVPDQYKFYHPSPDVYELFLLGNSGQADPNRVMMFERDNHRNWVQDMDRIFIDGTFTLAPPLFSQVFVILAKRAECVFPVMYALLPNKRQEAYHGLFGLIKTIWPVFNPTSISLDFEMAVMNSVRQAFPRAKNFMDVYPTCRKV